MATLPQFQKTIDNAFVETWYEIRPKAIDNILNATVVWALLKEMGCFKTQTGGKLIERTIKYAVGVTPQEVSKGDTLPAGEVETETAAFWTFRNLASHIQRDTISDRENQGKFQIKSYVAKRTTEARDALVQRYETDVLRATVTAETGKNIQSLMDLLPLYADATSGTYGGIARPATFAQVAATNGVYAGATGNTFWGSKYKQLTAPYEVNLLSDMKILYNSVSDNKEPPKVLLCDQALFEIYEEFAVDKSQIVKDASTKMADLGFEVLRFKGKPLVWTPNIAASNMMMLNTDFIEVVYDPTLWFAMTPFKDQALEMTRIAHILCAMNIVGTQPRRHGRLTSATVS